MRDQTWVSPSKRAISATVD